jgi:ketosteroid isomerase-like protein
MSEESTTPVVELLRSAVEAANRRDFDALGSFFTPGAVYDLSPSGFGTYEGLAAIRALFEEWWSVYDELESEVEEVLDLLHGVVFVVLLQNGRPVGSTGFLQQRQGWVMVVVDGMVVRVMAYRDPDEARAAAERLAQERG